MTYLYIQKQKNLQAKVTLLTKILKLSWISLFRFATSIFFFGKKTGVHMWNSQGSHGPNFTKELISSICGGVVPLLFVITFSISSECWRWRQLINDGCKRGIKFLQFFITCISSLLNSWCIPCQVRLTSCLCNFLCHIGCGGRCIHNWRSSIGEASDRFCWQSSLHNSLKMK